MKQEESALQAKLRGAELYHNNIVTNKDGQIQTMRDQTNTCPEANQEKNGFDLLRNWPIRAEAVKVQASCEARRKVNDVENKAKLEVGHLSSHLSLEKIAARGVRS